MDKAQHAWIIYLLVTGLGGLGFKIMWPWIKQTLGIATKNDIEAVQSKIETVEAVVKSELVDFKNVQDKNFDKLFSQIDVQSETILKRMHAEFRCIDHCGAEHKSVDRKISDHELVCNERDGKLKGSYEMIKSDVEKLRTWNILLGIFVGIWSSVCWMSGNKRWK